MELVFMESMNLHTEPFTTSEVIAEYASIDHHAVQQLVVTHVKRLEKFGVIAFEMRKPPKGSKGGRPKKIYHLNEEQATLLITFLDNTDTVADFKVELVRQFFAMKHELMQRNLLRESGKPVRRSMTDAIKAQGLSPHYYITYTSLAYKSALGVNTRQLKQVRSIPPKATVTDFLTSEELAAVSKREGQIATLIDLGMDYQQIKTILNNQGIIYQTTLELPAANEKTVTV